MNYISLINKFWQCNEERPIGCNATALYFYLMKVCNSLGWKRHFKHSDRYIAMQLGISVNTVRGAKNKLKQLGLLEFVSPEKASKGLEGSTVYSFEKLTISKFDTVHNTDADTVVNTVPDTDVDTVPDTINKLNKTKGLDIKKEGIDFSDSETLPWDKPKHEREKSPPVAAAPPLQGFEKVKDDCLSSVQWQILLKKSCDLPDIATTVEWLKKFFDKLEADGETNIDLKRAREYAGNWIRQEMRKQAQDKAKLNGNGHSKPIQKSKNKVTTLLNAAEAAKEIARSRAKANEEHANESVDNFQ